MIEGAKSTSSANSNATCKVTRIIKAAAVGRSVTCAAESRVWRDAVIAKVGPQVVVVGPGCSSVPARPQTQSLRVPAEQSAVVKGSTARK